MMHATQEHILGIDLGTTGCRAIIYTSALRPVGKSSHEYPIITDRPGEVEQDANLWWEALTRSVREAVHDAGVSAATIRALSVSSQGIAFVPVDQDERPVCNALSWLDTRATAESQTISARIGDDRIRSLTGKRSSPYYILPKLMWLREHRPEAYHDAARHLMAHDFALLRLCGVAATDHTLASGSLAYDIEGGHWSSELLAMAGVSSVTLPTIRRAGSVAGTVRQSVAEEMGLSPETLVCVGGQDQHCAALGAGTRSREAGVSLGTACQILLRVDRPDTDPSSALPCSPALFAGEWTLDGIIATAGASLRWLRDTFYPHSTYADVSDLASRAPAGSGAVFFYPHLAGGGSPRWLPESTGAFAGLSLATGSGEIIRAVLEGVAFQIYASIIAAGAPHRPNGLCIYGGGAESEPWCQIISDVTGLPVRVSAIEETATAGAAILAGLGAGIYETAAEAARLVGHDRHFEPDLSRHEQYEGIFADYQEMESRMWPGGQVSS
jgi:xylulokinase